MEPLFLPQVQTFRDYLSSYEPGKEQAHLPTAEEVKRQYPNPCGYSTGMEDGMILGGAMLSLICDRFAVTGEESPARAGRAGIRGMRRCATVHGVPGFIARNVCPEDGKSIYINSSAINSPTSFTGCGSITTARSRTTPPRRRSVPFSRPWPNA